MIAHSFADNSSRSPSSLTVRIWLIALITLCGLGNLSCDPSPPSFIELSAPRGSIDRLGPYVFTARVVGAVDQVEVVWIREVPVSPGDQEAQPDPPSLDRPSDRQRLALRLDGEVWTGALDGGAPIATYRYYLEATGSGGVTREPISGSDSFEVESLTGRCLTDSECLSGEVCHRDERYCFVPPERCGADFHCPRDQFCNLATQQCRFYDNGCVDDRECGANARCIDSVCVSMPPVCDPPCSGGARCEQGTCVGGPLSCDPPCEGTDLCVAGRCELATCEFNSDCPEGYQCDFDQGRCLFGERGVFCDPCGSASSETSPDCGLDFGCAEGVTGCRPLCGPDGVRCRDSEYCLDGVCIGGDNLIDCFAFECLNSEECESGVCQRGRCVDPLPCRDEADCRSGELCYAGECFRFAECELGSCPQGERCWAGVCEQYPAEPSSCRNCFSDNGCAPNEHCSLGFSDESQVCMRLCSHPSHCIEGQACVFVFEESGYCVNEEDQACGGEPTPQDCLSDNAEPNNSFEQATLLSLSDEAQTTDLFWQCLYEDDYFELDYNSGDRYEIEWYSEGASLIYLLNEEREIIAEIDHFLFPTGESAVFNLEGARFIQVVGIEESSTQYFFMIFPLSGGGGGGCDDDSLEENDTINQSYRIGRGAELSLTLCPGDEDWFSARGQFGEVFVFSWERVSGGASEVEISTGDVEAFREGSERVEVIREDTYSQPFTFSNGEVRYFRLRCPLCETPIRYTFTTNQ